MAVMHLLHYTGLGISQKQHHANSLGLSNPPLTSTPWGPQKPHVVLWDHVVDQCQGTMQYASSSKASVDGTCRLGAGSGSLYEEAAPPFRQGLPRYN